MNKLALLLLLVLPACTTLGENAQLTQAALDHDRALCVARGDQIGSDEYARCMVKFGHREGYRVAEADNGQIVFALPGSGALPTNPPGGNVGISAPPLPPQQQLQYK